MSVPTTDLADSTATELVHLYRTGQASPVDATQAVLTRIAECDPTLNAFCIVDAEHALAAAKASKARWQADQGRKVTVPGLQKRTLRRGELGTLMRQFHQRYDLLLTSGLSVSAFEAKATDEWALGLDTFLGWTPFSYPFNRTQQPAAVVPCGLTRSGLPISLQIVGPMHADALVLRAARAYESTREWKLPVSVTTGR